MGTDLKISNNPVNGVLLTHLKIIDVKDGDVFHAIKNTDAGFNGFGRGKPKFPFNGHYNQKIPS